MRHASDRVGLRIAIWVVAPILWGAWDSMPGGWDDLRIGMPRESVHGIVAGPIDDMRDLKGIECGHKGIGPCEWTIVLRYDSSDRLVEAYARRTDGPWWMLRGSDWVRR